MSKGEITVRNHGWSPELLTVLGAMFAIGVGLAVLILNMQAQIRQDMHGMESRIREELRAIEIRIGEDMASVEARIREDMATIELRIREDVRELRGDAGEVRERVSHLEGCFDGGGIPLPRPEEAPLPT